MTTTPLSTMIYPYPWDLAVRANQQRYPTHERVPILKRSEIILDETYFSRHDLDNMNTKNMIIQPYYHGQDQELFPDGQPPKNLEQHPELLPPSDTVAVTIISSNKSIPDVDNDNEMTTIKKEAVIPKYGVRRIVRRVYLQTPTVAKIALRMNELVVRHESWIDVKRRELRIVTWNETWGNTAMVGDITVYRGIKGDPSQFRGKVPVAPMGTDHRTFVGPIERTYYHGKSDNATNIVSQQQQGGEKMTLFLQYAYFKISPTLRIPFRSTIETKCLNCYHNNTQEGRKLDMEFMQQEQEKEERDEKKRKKLVR
ncbi:hypothetical protein INT45_004722 [Circinella minor]|uniref:Uncharacterized protein n=1 Tax=Circinella minor TaxID=1195481 RepID=A0A8H7SDQ6_9FUNG|nr:hypothetical protein INT45_004722 [Circinella minor]